MQKSLVKKRVGPVEDEISKYVKNKMFLFLTVKVDYFANLGYFRCIALYTILHVYINITD